MILVITESPAVLGWVTQITKWLSDVPFLPAAVPKWHLELPHRLQNLNGELLASGPMSRAEFGMAESFVSMRKAQSAFCFSRFCVVRVRNRQALCDCTCLAACPNEEVLVYDLWCMLPASAGCMTEKDPPAEHEPNVQMY